MESELSAWHVKILPAIKSRLTSVHGVLILKNLFSNKGKVAIVTGGSRGIGAMIAQGFVEDTANALVEGIGECIPMVAV